MSVIAPTAARKRTLFYVGFVPERDIAPFRARRQLVKRAYDLAGTDWKLSVSVNGIGKPDGGFERGKSGLGTGIVKALSRQLNAQVEILANPKDTPVSITHATFAAKENRAA